MSDQEFLDAFADAIGASPGHVQMTTSLRELDVWDSVAYLSTIVLLDEKLGVAMSPDDLVNAQTPADILNAVRAAQ